MLVKNQTLELELYISALENYLVDIKQFRYEQPQFNNGEQNVTLTFKVNGSGHSENELAS